MQKGTASTSGLPTVLVHHSPLTSVVTWKATVGARGIAALQQGEESWWEMVITSELPSSKSPLGSK